MKSFKDRYIELFYDITSKQEIYEILNKEYFNNELSFEKFYSFKDFEHIQEYLDRIQVFINIKRKIERIYDN